MRRATTPKSLRLSADELARFARLQRYVPEATSESALLKLAALRGLALLEAEVAGAGGGVPPGMTEEEVASVILPRILTVVTWLARRGRLPMLGPAPAARPELAPDAEEHPALAAIDPTAAADLDGLGGDLLGAWPD